MSIIRELSANLLTLAEANHYSITSAESCTGGLLMASLTEIPGASAVILQGFITYHNQAKSHYLNVSDDVLNLHGAVSEQTVTQMAQGAWQQAKHNMPKDYQQKNILAIAITGIAGASLSEQPEETILSPAGKQNGLVYIGLYNGDKLSVTKHGFKGNRVDVRAETVITSLQLATQYLKQ